MKYYTIQDNQILIADKEESLTRFYNNVLPLPKDYEIGKYTVVDGALARNSNYKEEQQEQEQERIQELSMTKSDFFDGMIRAFGLDQDDLQPAIEAILTQLFISDIDKKVAMNNYKNAKDFYRKHTLFTLLSDREIPISETQSIKISSVQWDKFFDETNKKNEEAYKELLGE